MKVIRILLATGASFAAVAGLRAETQSGRQWLEQYYRNPRPQDLITEVRSLDREGYFATAAQRDTAIGFFSVVFRQNPQEVGGWLRAASRVLPETPRRVLAAAAWYAGSPAAAQQLRQLSASDALAERQDIARLAASGSRPEVAAIPVASEPALNLQWGAFLASGEQRYLGNVFAAFGSEQPGLSAAARYTLVRSAVGDPHVMDLCRSELARQPASVRAEFNTALDEAQSRKSGA